MVTQNNKKLFFSWRGLFFLTFFISFGYVFLEWLFMVTKPSFMTSLTWLSKVGILLFTMAFVICLSLLTVFILFLLSRIIFLRKFSAILWHIAIIVPAFTLAALMLILFDNFTYTVLRFGIVTSVGFQRVIYAIGFLIILVLIAHKMVSWTFLAGKRKFKVVSVKVLGSITVLLLLAIILIPLITQTTKKTIISNMGALSSNKDLPNIFLITADGLNADHMSVYGYDRETTPFLEELADQSLIIENSFPNSAKTTGSIISILTGKYVADTRVLYPPDILKNEDSYQHLPGMLRQLGYYTVQYGQPYYLDSYSQNLLNGFDEVNGNTHAENKYLEVLSSIARDDDAYFIYEIFNRIFDRLCHIFFIESMDNVYLQVTDSNGAFGDYLKIQKMFELIENADQPLFVHLHWMGTHGELFNPRNQVFSAGKVMAEQKPWDDDFYDDMILEFDETLRGIDDKLQDVGLASNTILIIASDHGQEWVADERLPLIFHFPFGQHANRQEANRQNLDIAPTLLDYLEVKKPEWMSGISLLESDDQQRLVFSVDVLNSLTEDENRSDLESIASHPPFYQFGELTMIDCNQSYQLNLVNFALEIGSVDSYNATCLVNPKPIKEVLNLMADHLKDNHFDTSTLEEWIDNYSSK